MENEKITIDGLAGMIKKGFDGVDKRFDLVNEKFDLIEKKLERIDQCIRGANK